ncbi:unnamed protein product, partial [Rotaria socialis]
MLYELNFEAICRFPANDSAFELEFLYNDHTFRHNTFYRNDGSGVGSERNWWFNPLPNSHHFIKSDIIELFSRFETLETNLLASSHDDLDGEHTAWLKNTNVSTTCYDDPTKDYSGRVASKVVLDNQTHVNETSLKFCDELRPNLILKTGGTGINSDDITPETNTPLVEDQCVVINIGTELPDTRR